MFSCRVRSVSAIFVAAGMLVGCASKGELAQRISGRWGPNPVIQPSEVSTAVQDQNEVLRYLAYGAGVAVDGPTTNSYSIRNPDDWFNVAEWGFNIGRQDCEIYLDNLFRMNREKQRNDSMLVAMGTAAAAIVTGTSHSQKALSVLAAAFGLTAALNDALFQSYLFTELPGLIANKVKELQDAYRDSVEKAPVGAKGYTHTPITTPEAAYNVIQNYYHICLPQTIDGTLLQAVSDTSATSTKGVNSTPKLVPTTAKK